MLWAWVRIKCRAAAISSTVITQGWDSRRFVTLQLTTLPLRVLITHGIKSSISDWDKLPASRMRNTMIMKKKNKMTLCWVCWKQRNTYQMEIAQVPYFDAFPFQRRQCFSCQTVLVASTPVHHRAHNRKELQHLSYEGPQGKVSFLPILDWN